MPDKKKSTVKKAPKPRRTDKQLIAIYEALDDLEMINVSQAIEGVRISNAKKCVFARYKGGAVYGTDKVPQTTRKEIEEALIDDSLSVNGVIRDLLGSKEQMVKTKYRRLI